jgi:hypothetical protein
VGGGATGGGRRGGLTEAFLRGQAEQAPRMYARSDRSLMSISASGLASRNFPAAQAGQQGGGLVAGDGLPGPLLAPALAGQRLPHSGVQVAVAAVVVGQQEHESGLCGGGLGVARAAQRQADRAGVGANRSIGGSQGIQLCVATPFGTSGSGSLGDRPVASTSSALVTDRRAQVNASRSPFHRLGSLPMPVIRGLLTRGTPGVPDARTPPATCRRSADLAQGRRAPPPRSAQQHRGVDPRVALATEASRAAGPLPC